MTGAKQTFLICLFLAAITLMAFHQVGTHGFINLDDNVYITKNFHIQSGITMEGLRWAFTAGYAGNWHPLTWISHMLDIQFFGLNPKWHHLTNLLFHAANVLLLFTVLHRMTKALWQSAFVAALFALHPLHVESVAWVAERKDVLSTFFWMLTLIAYQYYAKRPHFKSYLVVIALFFLGLTAKPMVASLPFVLLLLDYWPLERFGGSESIRAMGAGASGSSPVRKDKGKRGKGTPAFSGDRGRPANSKFGWTTIRPLVLEKIPLFALAALSCVVTYIVQKKGGAFAPSEIYTPTIRIENALVSYILYIAKTIWPNKLAVFYPHPGSLPLWQVLGAFVLVVATTAAVFGTARRFPYLPVGWLWFTGTLVPVIGIVQVGGQALADRYMYIPSIGLFVMIAWGIAEFFRKQTKAREVLAVLAAVSLLCLFLLTWKQDGYWRDNVSLFDHALDVTENNFAIYNNRGGVYEELGNHKQAIADFDRAIGINPNSAPAFNNRGNAWYSLGNYTQAVEDFTRAIQISPGYAEAYNNRGIVYSSMDNYIRAIEDFDRAIEIKPEYAKAYYCRGTLQGFLGNQRQATEDLKTAAKLGYEEALNSLKTQQ
jgi:Tfp pilus assembly protein PilF